MISRIFHAATLGLNVFITYYWSKMDIPAKMNVNMPHLRTCWWQYLTVWNLLFQGCYFAICLADDILKTIPRKVLVEVKERVHWVRDTMFQSIVLPLCMGVFTIFWVTYLYDRQLIYPPQMDAIIPLWLNHLIHTTIVIFPWAELLICRRPFKHFKIRYFYGLGLMVLYNCMLVAASAWQCFWTYPMLSLMTPFQRGLFFCLTYTIFTTAYVVGCKANSKVCGYSLKDSIGKRHRFAETKNLWKE